VAGGNVMKNAFRISPDNGRVVYCADQETNGTWDMFVSHLYATDAQRWELYKQR